MNGLTKRQAEILAFVQQFIDRHSYSPSLSEIGGHFGFASVNAAAKHLNSLKRKGYLQAEPHRRRSISLPLQIRAHSDPTSLAIPLIGVLSAGEPIETFAQITAIEIPSSMAINPEQMYALKISDDSLMEEMLLEGDILLVEARTDPQQGETVVAVVNQHDTLIARYFIDGDYIKLMSHTPHHQPIILKQSDLSIKGIVVASLRNYVK